MFVTKAQLFPVKNSDSPVKATLKLTVIQEGVEGRASVSYLIFANERGDDIVHVATVPSETRLKGLNLSMDESREIKHRYSDADSCRRFMGRLYLSDAQEHLQTFVEDDPDLKEYQSFEVPLN